MRFLDKATGISLLCTSALTFLNVSAIHAGVEPPATIRVLEHDMMNRFGPGICYRTVYEMSGPVPSEVVHAEFSIGSTIVTFFVFLIISVILLGMVGFIRDRIKPAGKE